MLRIPLLRRQPKHDSSQGEDGKRTALPGLSVDRQMMHPLVTEDAEKAFLLSCAARTERTVASGRRQGRPPSYPQDSPPALAEPPRVTDDAVGEPAPVQGPVPSENEPSSLVNDEDGEVSASSKPDDRTDRNAEQMHGPSFEQCLTTSSVLAETESFQ